MAHNVYECMFIFDSNKYARDPGGVSEQVPAMVEKLGGEVLVSRLWTEQKLAYQIDGHRKGTYWLSYFRLDGDKVTEFNRACQLNDSVLRNLTLKVEPRLVEALVSHAQGNTTEKEEVAVETAAVEVVSEETSVEAPVETAAVETAAVAESATESDA